MRELVLTRNQRFRLRQQLTHTRDAATCRRTLAILELDEGKPLAQVAHSLGVARQTIYNWLDAYCEAFDPSALADAARWAGQRPGPRICRNCFERSCMNNPVNGGIRRRSGRCRSCDSNWPVGTDVGFPKIPSVGNYSLGLRLEAGSVRVASGPRGGEKTDDSPAA